MKILIVVNSLQQGGAERASLRLADSLVNDGHKVVLATWNSSRDFYQLNDEVTRINLGNFFETKKFKVFGMSRDFTKLGLIINLFRYRKNILKQKPEVVICFEALIGSITVFSTIGSRIPIIVSERINPDPEIYNPHWIARKLRPWIYKKYAICSVQTEGFFDWVRFNWKIEPAITPNHIPESWIQPARTQFKRDKKIVSIGRIDYQKGYDLLIEAWSSLGDKTKDWTLEIYGRDENSGYSKQLKNNASGNVFFHGETLNVIEVLDSAHAFISSSRYEGFPNIVLESLARGVPTIAAFSSDVINSFDKEGAVMGYETEDTFKLANFIDTILFNQELAIQLSENAQKTIMNYTWKNVGENWYKAIDLAIGQQQKSFWKRFR